MSPLCVRVFAVRLLRITGRQPRMLLHREIFFGESHGQQVRGKERRTGDWELD